MLLRVLVVAVVLLVAFGSARVVGRRKGRIDGVVPTGLTLVIGPNCHTCVRAIAALDGAGAEYRVVDVATAKGYGVHSFSVPYAIVGDAAGDVAAVRRGAAVVHDAKELAELATR